MRKSLLSFFSLYLFYSNTTLAASGLETAAQRAKSLCCKNQEKLSTEEALEAALQLINVLTYTHLKEPPPPPPPIPPAPEPPPRLPTGGTHPYEWDSIRPVEKMLTDLDGGTCGTHGLSIAAITEKLAASESEGQETPSARPEVYVVGGVFASDYRAICPEEDKAHLTKFPNETGGFNEFHPLNGHVFVLAKVRLDSTTEPDWYLFDSTHNPDEHVGATHGNRAAACKYKLASFQHVKFKSPDEILASYDEKLPIQIPLDPFPSLREGIEKSNSVVRPMLVFAVWAPKNYPEHTLIDRMNLVASGSKDNATCRWTLP